MIIDVQGNGGGYIDAGTELAAQLFPNVKPDQKGNVRRSPGLEVTLAKMGKSFEIDEKSYDDSSADMDLLESSFDLMTNPLFSVPERPENMIPKPFVLNDAIAVKMKIRLPAPPPPVEAASDETLSENP